MSFVSLSEDIDKIRQDNDHYLGGIDNLLNKLRSTPSLEDLRRYEADLKAVSTELVAHFESVRQQAAALFDEALKLLNDVSVTDKLGKVVKQRNQTRIELKRCLGDLEKSRISQSKALSKISELETENSRLKYEIDKLKSERDWTSAREGVTPLKKTF